jgi:hypothetical protein
MRQYLAGHVVPQPASQLTLEAVCSLNAVADGRVDAALVLALIVLQNLCHQTVQGSKRTKLVVGIEEADPRQTSAQCCIETGPQRGTVPPIMDVLNDLNARPKPLLKLVVLVMRAVGAAVID